MTSAHFILRSFVYLLLLLTPLLAEEKLYPVTIQIDYGSERPSQTISANYRQGTTALQLLTSVATVRTRQVGNYQFVASINGLKSIPGKMGWFYTLDGEDAKVTASVNELDGISQMRWVYRVENCLSQ